MAHQNIESRREAVREALGSGRSLSMTERSKLACRFGCTPAAIWADVLTIINGSVFHISPSMKNKIIKRDGNTCYLCGQTTNSPIIEHKIPARAGGKPTEDNLAVSCQSCNIKKRYRDEIIYPY